MATKMTDRWVQSLKATARQREVTDTLVKGLRVRVAVSGSKSWVVAYRAGGQTRRLTLGPFPTLSLSAARQAAGEVLAKVKLGADPIEEQRAQREAPRPETWGTLVQRYLEQHASKKRDGGAEDARILAKYLPKEWSGRPAASIERREVRALIDEVTRRGPVMANRVLACLHTVCNFGLDREVLEQNPCSRVPRCKEKPRNRVLTRGELRALWRALDDEDTETAAMVRLLVLTGQRKGEVLRLRWSHLDLDGGELDGPRWRIPSNVAKNAREHIVPLVPAAVALLQALPSRAVGGWVFPSHGESGHRTSLQKVTARLREAVRAADSGKGEATGDREPFRLHDIRRSVCSYLGELGVSRVVQARLFNHAEHDVTGRVYDQGTYSAQKRSALDRWSAYLDRIVRDEPAEKVVPLPVRA
jgi:integrase